MITRICATKGLTLRRRKKGLSSDFLASFSSRTVKTMIKLKDFYDSTVRRFASRHSKLFTFVIDEKKIESKGNRFRVAADAIVFDKTLRRDICRFIRQNKTMSDVIFGPLDESEEAVAAVNEFAEKNDDPDMQVKIFVKIQTKSKRFSTILRCRKTFTSN